MFIYINLLALTFMHISKYFYRHVIGTYTEFTYGFPVNLIKADIYFVMFALNNIVCTYKYVLSE